MRKRLCIRVGLAVGAMMALVACQPGSSDQVAWTDAELAEIRSMSIDSLPPLAADRSNAVADNALARRLGEALFFEPRLSSNQAVSCATCHQPLRHFTDGLRKGQAVGTSNRNTPSITGSAHSPWLYWDGRRDSQWSQALSPLEDPDEHNSNRLQIVKVVANDESYRRQYERLFGPMPSLDDDARFPVVTGAPTGSEWQKAWSAMTAQDQHLVNRAFANIGKAIAAFERSLMPTASRFDAYAAALSVNNPADSTLLTDDEVRGCGCLSAKQTVHSVTTDHF